MKAKAKKKRNPHPLVSKATWKVHVESLYHYDKTRLEETYERNLRDNSTNPELKPVYRKLASMRLRYGYPVKPNLYAEA